MIQKNWKNSLVEDEFWKEKVIVHQKDAQKNSDNEQKSSKNYFKSSIKIIKTKINPTYSEKISKKTGLSSSSKKLKQKNLIPAGKESSCKYKTFCIPKTTGNPLETKFLVNLTIRKSKPTKTCYILTCSSFSDSLLNLWFN